jgi:hypothetical protein
VDYQSPILHEYVDTLPGQQKHLNQDELLAICSVSEDNTKEIGEGRRTRSVNMPYQMW